MKYQIHVNVNVIRYNGKHGTNYPQCRVQEGTKAFYCKEVKINGNSILVSPENPLKCGAKVWIETDGPISMIGQTKYSEIRKAMKA